LDKLICQIGFTFFDQNKKKQEGKFGTAEIKFLRSVTGSTRKDETRNAGVGRC
jgi:hypothetical protein